MKYFVCAISLLAVPAAASAEDTNWGIRALPGVGSGPIVVPPKNAYVDPSLRRDEPAMAIGSAAVRFSIGAIARIGARWGQVTSTLRSPAHNRRVGGMPNSYHLSGRAIDIARRPGVSHWQIASALRAAGYNLLESLDEGDHSHFAFGNPGEIKVRHAAAPRPASKGLGVQLVSTNSSFNWKVVYAPGGGAN